MTIPIERTRAVLDTETFLYRLLDPADTPRVPRVVRDEGPAAAAALPDRSRHGDYGAGYENIWKMPK